MDLFKKFQQSNDIEETSEPLNMSWPKEGRKRLTYVLVAPILIPLCRCIYTNLLANIFIGMYPNQVSHQIYSFLLYKYAGLTLPDTRTPRGKNFFVITFIGSILWIAAYSYLMVWWANVFGETADIPPEVSVK